MAYFPVKLELVSAEQHFSVNSDFVLQVPVYHRLYSSADLLAPGPIRQPPFADSHVRQMIVTVLYNMKHILLYAFAYVI